MTYEDVPLMFQAQISGRCQLQRVEGKEQHPAYEWKNQWTKSYSSTQSSSNQQPTATTTGQAFAQAFAKLGIEAQPAKPTETNTNDFLKEPPKFNLVGENARTWEYKISWRLVSNCGQDEGFIRPIIGAKGYPYFSGSSMKGAFRRACTPEQKRNYCGEEIIEDGIIRTKPGILRFHGGYPTDTSWTENLVDIVHSQENKQVKRGDQASANAMISLHQVTLRFGISTTNPEKTNWQEVEQIWDKAVGRNLGSRTSAGYGQLQKVVKVGKKTETQLLVPKHKVLVKVSLNGQGLASVLLKENNSNEHNTPEFRPNMFKAALRGHTLRLFGGITNENTAEYLTKLLWGGFREGYNGNRAQWEREKNAIAGLLGISFECKSKEILKEQTYTPNPKIPNEKRSTPVYNLKNGVVQILSMYEQEPVAQSDLIQVAEALIKFSLLLGGFGKSWRRIDHQKFFQHYTKSKPTIGCHWEVASGYENFYIPVDKLDDIKRLIDSVQQILRNWANKNQMQLPNGRASSWREAWYPYSPGRGGVQVWGRFTTDQRSKAINWFHESFDKINSIKNTPLTGWAGKKDSPARTGRIWHRMYPHYQMQAGKLKPTGGYVELLTIFPNQEPVTQQFLNYLPTQGFTKVW